MDRSNWLMKFKSAQINVSIALVKISNVVCRSAYMRLSSRSPSVSANS